MVVLAFVLAFAIYARPAKRAKWVRPCHYDRDPFFQPCQYDHMILNKQQLQDTKYLFVRFIDFAKTVHVTYFAIAGTLIGITSQPCLVSG